MLIDLSIFTPYIGNLSLGCIGMYHRNLICQLFLYTELWWNKRTLVQFSAPFNRLWEMLVNPCVSFAIDSSLGWGITVCLLALGIIVVNVCV